MKVVLQFLVLVSSLLVGLAAQAEVKFTCRSYDKTLQLEVKLVEPNDSATRRDSFTVKAAPEIDTIGAELVRLSVGQTVTLLRGQMKNEYLHLSGKAGALGSKEIALMIHSPFNATLEQHAGYLNRSFRWGGGTIPNALICQRM